MPELPEVEVVRQGLSKILSDNPVIADIQFYRGDLRDPIPQKKLRTLIGLSILSVQRRAKYLLFETTGGKILSHLGMTGSWRREKQAVMSTTKIKRKPMQKHDHVAIVLQNGNSLVYCDPRRFGILDFIDRNEKNHPRLKHLGPEPLTAEFTAEKLWKSLRNKKCSIKSALMDQKIVVGVGNIYVAEALFQAQISPLAMACKVSLEKCQKLVSSIQSVLRQAIEAGGSSISDYRQANGDSGSFQNRHQVYDRASQPCFICTTPIRRKVIVGRSSFWCPNCQKK